jgi:hypothetical protein
MTEPDERVATVIELPSKWSLVEFGTWSVSVSPDAMIMLPRHIPPDEVPDFVGAMLAAAEVGTKIKADNEASGAKDDRSRPSRRVRVTEGALPPGAVRVPTRAAVTASIGRRGGRRTNPPPRGSQGFPSGALSSTSKSPR